MNEMNSLETQLHSWQPRPPSAGLKRRLFAKPVRLMPRMAWFVGWLVPVTACAALTISVFTSSNALPSSRHTPLMATLSNQNFLTPAPESSRSRQNSLLSVTFDLTNYSGSTSSLTTFPRRGMN